MKRQFYIPTMCTVIIHAALLFGLNGTPVEFRNVTAEKPIECTIPNLEPFWDKPEIEPDDSTSDTETLKGETEQY